MGEQAGMTAPPDGLDPARHGEGALAWKRRIFRVSVLSALALLVVAGLANVFGSRAAADRAESGIARLEVSAPTAVRGGLFFQGRFRIEALVPLEHATLVLDEGWQERLSINTIVPSPVSERSRDGKLALDFGALSPGRPLVAFLQFQVDPAQRFVRRPQGVALTDGERQLLRIERTLTVYP